jgi:LuxR family maltose regulon positive regulatory protein
MKHRKSRTTEIHYYSDRLKQKLSQLRFAPATVVEAPSGYGKTTAIRDVLKHGIPQGTPVHWFAAVEESPQAGFRRLCCTINKIDNRAGERLLKIGLPNSANVGEACDALRSIQCNQETYLVIDNFQIIQSFLSVTFFSALVEHGGKGLHIIIITILPL